MAQDGVWGSGWEGRGEEGKVENKRLTLVGHLAKQQNI